MESSRYKEIAVVSFAVLYTIAFFAYAAFIFRGQQEWSPAIGYVLSGAAILWASCIALSSVLIQHRNAFFILLALLPGVVSVLIGGIRISSLIGAAVAFLFTFIAQHSIVRELTSHIKIRISTVFSFGARLLLYGMFVSFIAISLPLIQATIASGKLAIPPSYLASIVNTKSVSLWMGKMIPGYAPDKTVDEMIAGQEGNPEFIKHELSGRLKITVSGQETGGQVVANTINAAIARYAAGDGAIVILVVIGIALLAVRALVPLIAWPTVLVIAFLFWIARATRLLSVVESQEMVESVEI